MLVAREERAPALAAASAAAKSRWDAVVSLARIASDAGTRANTGVRRAWPPRCGSGPPLPLTAESNARGAEWSAV